MEKWKYRGIFLQTITGMKFGTLLRVLMRNRFQVDLCYFHRLVYLGVLGAWNSIMAVFEQRCKGHRIAATKIKAPPLFILGHWRSGTTHLHNLLSLDTNFICPTLYMVMFPNHFGYTRPWGEPIFNKFSPTKRPMDNMAISLASPHEDELALAAISTISPCMRMLFPVTGDPASSALDPLRLHPKDLQIWKDSLQHFVQKVTFSKGNRVVLKSPPHMGRVRILLELFPQAKFIHIVRNPYRVYLSSRKLWKDGIGFFHLQVPNPQVIDEIILSWYEELFFLFERDRHVIPSGSLHELKFEDLEERPKECLQKLYADLGLPGFDSFWPRVAAYLESIKGYQKNTYVFRKSDVEKVNRRWRETFLRYGYPMLSVGSQDTVELT